MLKISKNNNFVRVKVAEIQKLSICFKNPTSDCCFDRRKIMVQSPANHNEN